MSKKDSSTCVTWVQTVDGNGVTVEKETESVLNCLFEKIKLKEGKEGNFIGAILDMWAEERTLKDLQAASTDIKKRLQERKQIKQE
jgi:hypothetical protein